MMRYHQGTMATECFYFAYGSNMSRSRLEERVGGVRDFGWSTLQGYRHAFNKRGADGTAKGNIMVADEDSVHGVLYQLTNEQLRTLAHYERGYAAKRVVVYAHDHATIYECATYRAIEITTGLLPHQDYLAHYEQGLREHSLPQDYCTRLFREGFLTKLSND